MYAAPANTIVRIYRRLRFLFTDEERAVVGTTHKQQKPAKTIKTGLDYFGPKMKNIVEDVEKIIASISQSTSKPLQEVWGFTTGVAACAALAFLWLLVIRL